MKKYESYLNLPGVCDYSLQRFLPVGLFLVDLMNKRGGMKSSGYLRWQLAEIYGGPEIAVYLRVHQAARLVSFLAGLTISLFLFFMAPQKDYCVFLFCLLLSGGMFFLPDYELKKRVQKRRYLLQLEFPDFLNKITLLIGAGMNIPRAWEKLVRESEKNTPLYRELRKSLIEMQAGCTIYQSFEGFAKRCRTPEINKFVTLILQNMKKGHAELLIILRVQAVESWEMRKQAARKLGEEASTKMLLPLCLILVAILLIVSAPAILAIQGI